jgi:hypothetical protein
MSSVAQQYYYNQRALRSKMRKAGFRALDYVYGPEKVAKGERPLRRILKRELTSGLRLF